MPSLAHAATIHRIEVRAAEATQSPRPEPVASGVVRQAQALGLPLTSCTARRVYLIAADLTDTQIDLVARRLLADPVIESAHLGSAAPEPDAAIIEVHPLPGVMDPAADSVVAAIADLLGIECEVATGWRYDLVGLSAAQADLLARSALANPVIHRITTSPYHPASFPHGVLREHEVRRITITTLNDAALEKLSREAHLFLSLNEMKALKAEYIRRAEEPREIELETLAQTWSEHCVHKTLKSRIVYRSSPPSATSETPPLRHSAASPFLPPLDPINWTNPPRPGHTLNPDGSITIDNLLKSTVAAATFELIAEGIDWTLSVFVDNSGVIALDDTHAVCIKVETHNHPSAIEPYGGAATGIGGCIRDIIGTGLGAQPIASTNVFCVANPGSFTDETTSAQSASTLPLRNSATSPLPRGCLPPARILTQVVAGVRDYGNRMGIPTVSGAVYFDDRYVGNPLVFCGCIGLIPRNRIKGTVQPGDRIVALGGRTGRDGIHGATFSSAELEHSAADEFAHAVQIGNAITEKRVLDAIMRARNEDAAGPLYNAMTDCGAGGFSSGVGEMGSRLGAHVNLERAPLKYPGLSPTEIWISEAQERMVLAVPEAKLARLKQICDQESVEMADLGHFGTPNRELILTFNGQEIGRLSMDFVHEGIPTPTREAEWLVSATGGGSAIGDRQSATGQRRGATGHEGLSTIADCRLPTADASSPIADSRLPVADASVPNSKDALLLLLAHPNIASKHWIIRQYDHEVRGSTVIKPLVGRAQRGPNDSSVIEPIPGSYRGVAISQGLQTGIGDPRLAGAFADPYVMTLAAIDECVRNLVCVGADPERIAILDNFCWPSCKKPENLGSLVRAAEACYDGAKAYHTPFVSGKDSLNNQFTGDDGRTIEIPPTLLITGIGIVPDISRCITSDAKKSGNVLLLIGPADSALGGSHFQRIFGLAQNLDPRVPLTNLKLGPRVAHFVARLIQSGVIASAHDVSDGGLLCAVSEMLIGGSTPGRPLGAALALADTSPGALFGEAPSRYVLEVTPAHAKSVLTTAEEHAIPALQIGELNTSGLLTEPSLRLSVVAGDLAGAWLKPLDW